LIFLLIKKKKIILQVIQKDRFFFVKKG